MKVIWPKLEGYKEYVKQVDLDQIQYESDELKIATKNTALPYAIIYGLKTDWENRFI
jgi:hypothetical protein